jgi:hypothetical protein
MVEYFLGIGEYWVNTKSVDITTSFGGKNTGKVNKP